MKAEHKGALIGALMAIGFVAALISTVWLGVMLVEAGDEVEGDEYDDAPEEIKDGSLDYQDYKDADCPYLGSTLDQETMKKCNDWIRNNESADV